MSSAGNATATYLIQNMSSSSIKMDMIYRKVRAFLIITTYTIHWFSLIMFICSNSNYSNIRNITCVADDILTTSIYIFISR